MPSIFDMILGQSPNVDKVDNSDPTGSYLGNMIDPNTAAQFQSALNQQRMLNFSAALGQASAPQLGKPVTFGGALSQAMGAVAATPDEFVGTTLKAAQARNTLTDSDLKKLQGAGLIQTLNFKQRMANLGEQFYGGQGGGQNATGGQGQQGQGQGGGTIGAPQSLLSNAYPAVSSKTADDSLPPEARALLDTISGPESKGAYNVRYTPQGGATFDSYAQHPQIYEPGPQGKSSAAGRYQMVASTWNPIAEQAGLKDFSPQSQDIGAWTLAQNTYQQKTGRNLLGDLQAGNLGQVGSALRGQWATLPNAMGGYYKNLVKYADSNAANNNQQPQGQPAQPEGAPQAGSAPQQFPAFATGAAPFTKTNSVGETYQWNGQGWQPVGNQAPANVKGGTSGAGDAVNGIDRTSGPVTTPIMSLLSNAEQPTQVASNGPLPRGLLASRNPGGMGPPILPPSILSGAAPPQQPQPPMQLAQAQAPGGSPYTYNPAPMNQLPVPPGGNQGRVNAGNLMNFYNSILGGKPDPYAEAYGKYGLDVSAAQAKANAEQKARAEAAFARGANQATGTNTANNQLGPAGNPEMGQTVIDLGNGNYREVSAPKFVITQGPGAVVSWLNGQYQTQAGAGAPGTPQGGQSQGPAPSPTLGGSPTPTPSQGVPNVPGAAFLGGPTFGKPIYTPQQQQEQSKRGEALGELPQKVNDAAESARNQQANLLVMRNDAQNIYTGKGAEILNTFAQYMRLVDPSYNQPVASAESFVKNGGALLRAAVKDTSGRAAVQEYNLISKTLPNLETSPQGLQQLLGEFMGFNDYKIAKAQALQDWINDPTHNNTAQGFEADFQKSVSPYAYLVLRMSPEQQNDMVTKLSSSDAGKKALSRIMGETQYIKAHNLEASY